jgi:hypothetical protein
MDTLFLWLYLTNAVLLVIHEMDSAYWQEWKLFRLPGGATGFLLLHFPILALLLYGVIWVWQVSTAGIVLSLVAAGGGIFAFGIHHYFLWKGRTEFDTLFSRAILWALLPISLAQIVVSFLILSQR